MEPRGELHHAQGPRLLQASSRPSRSRGSAACGRPGVLHQVHYRPSSRGGRHRGGRPPRSTIKAFLPPPSTREAGSRLRPLTTFRPSAQRERGWRWHAFGSAEPTPPRLRNAPRAAPILFAVRRTVSRSNIPDPRHLSLADARLGAPSDGPADFSLPGAPPPTPTVGSTTSRRARNGCCPRASAVLGCWWWPHLGAACSLRYRGLAQQPPAAPRCSRTCPLAGRASRLGYCLPWGGERRRAGTPRIRCFATR